MPGFRTARDCAWNGQSLDVNMLARGVSDGDMFGVGNPAHHNLIFASFLFDLKSDGMHEGAKICNFSTICHADLERMEHIALFHSCAVGLFEGLWWSCECL